MSLGSKQRDFTEMIGKLICHAYSMGYELTFGDAYRDPRVHGEFGEKKSYSAAKSVHKLKLAVDFNLFVNGEYIQSSSHEAWGILHDYWSLIGGAERISNDANHFSVEHNGVR